MKISANNLGNQNQTIPASMTFKYNLLIYYNKKKEEWIIFKHFIRKEKPKSK